MTEIPIPAAENQVAKPERIHPDHLYTIKDVAIFAKISIPTIWRNIKQDRFPAPVKIGGSNRWSGKRLIQLFETGE